jgi:hypothetical protein
MKKQNGKNNLTFNKSVVTELNDNLLNDINGGSTPACFVASVMLSYVIVRDALAD